MLAKSNPPQSLHSHLTEVRAAMQVLLTPARLRVFARVGIETARAEELALSAAWLHDWGKATQEWQFAIRAGQRTLPQHSLTGFLACLWALNVKQVETMPRDLLAVALAVLGHHGQLSDGSFSAEHFAHQDLTVPWAVWEEMRFDLPILGCPKPGPRVMPTKLVCEKVSHAKSRCAKLTLDGKFHGLYCLLLTLLVQADHAASGGHTPDTRILTPPHRPGELTSFQQTVQAQAADALCAVAGCGSGKTLAALLRAAEYAEAVHADRIVLCLPTRFTGNSLLRDMSDPAKYAYPSNQVGLVHSEALQVLRARTNDDEEDFADSADDIATKSVRYEMPVTVSTVDHLLMSLYHGYKFADRAFGNLLSSLVVFDEVHAYDATTLNAIREGLNVLSAYGVPTLFLSATLPSSRRRFFGLSPTNTVIESDNPYKPFRIEKMTGSLTVGQGLTIEASAEARQCLQKAKGLKLAVYVNQVERAKALTRAAVEELPDIEDRIFCYHSELAPCDRQALERRVIDAFKEDLPVVLIATQAAELSLDISAERMISELAPADVLIQRGGRLNRRGLLPELARATSRLQEGFRFRLLVAPLDLTPNDKGKCPVALPYKDFNLLQTTLDKTPWGEEFTYALGLDWCEAVLTDEPPTLQIGLQEATRTDAAFGKKPQENFAGEENTDGVTIRDIDDEVKLVLPEIYLNKPTATLTALAQLQVPIRRRKFHAIDAGLVETQNRSFTVKRGSQFKTIDYELTIIKSNLVYNPGRGGFDFRVSDVPLPPGEAADAFL